MDLFSDRGLSADQEAMRLEADTYKFARGNPNEADPLRNEMLRAFIKGEMFDVCRHSIPPSEEAYATVFAGRCLQDTPDYRAALQSWFAGLKADGHLIIVVPHAFLAERQLSLPVKNRPNVRRLYTPRALLDEIEESLAPNSYRVRLLCDDDRDYDYNIGAEEPATGHSDILLVVQKITQPSWSLATTIPIENARPSYAFTRARTRNEATRRKPHSRILVLKLDHLGDFIISISAIQRLRAHFPAAHITLVVGSWNLGLAQDLSLADEIIAFDAFPRNSSEQEVDVPGKRALLEQVLPERYDLAVDLRTDTDTRTLLGRVNSRIKAGLGTKANFPFLDIALPIDLDRVEREAAREMRVDHHAFHSQDSVLRLPHRAVFSADRLSRSSAIIWGPYWRLQPGRYIFDPFLEIDASKDGLLMLDVGIDLQRVARRVIGRGDPAQIEFDVENTNSMFEFRIWPVEEAPALEFSFFGGRLIREGTPGELHQSDYLELLVDLVARRLDRVGLLTEIDAT